MKSCCAVLLEAQQTGLFYLKNIFHQFRNMFRFFKWKKRRSVIFPLHFYF